MSPAGVHILDVSQIPLPLPPPSPVKLAFLDFPWIISGPMLRLMLYPDPTSDLPFHSLVRALKSSLLATLVDFPTLAGKLAYVASTETVEIDLEAPEVTFVEAESGLDVHRLATSEVHDVESFRKLLPMIDVGVMPFPVFAVQVTKFDGGGVAVGLAAHHAVVDGKALLQFMEAWTGNCKAQIDDDVDAVLSTDERRPPVYDRAVIKYPKGEEIAAHIRKSLMPYLPSTRCPLFEAKGRPNGHYSPPVRRTFTVDSSSIQFLKKQAHQLQLAHENGDSAARKPPSTFAAISAHVWSCIARSKPFGPDEPTVFNFLMDCRSRLDPPVPEDYFGNCVRSTTAWARSGDVMGDGGLYHACVAIQKAIHGVLEAGVAGECENWVEDMMKLPGATFVNATASPRFRMYDAADFGWGRPGRFESVSMNRPGEFAVVAGREEGSVQVTVVLHPDTMAHFAEHFVGGLGE